MKIKITKSSNEWFETEGYRIMLTLLDGSRITMVEPIYKNNSLCIRVDEQLIIHPTSSNSCDLSIKKD